MVENWEEWKVAYDHVLESGQALAKLCGHATSKQIAQDLTRLNKQARHVFDTCELNEKQARFNKGVKQMKEWLSGVEDDIQRPFPLSYNSVRNRLQDLEVSLEWVALFFIKLPIVVFIFVSKL